MDTITKAGILLNAIRAPQKVFSRLCSDYDPEELWSSQSIWQELGLKARMTERLTKLLVAGWVESEEERLENFDARFITSFDIDYPAKLFDLSNPPVGLYVKGSVNLSQPSVAIVGTRKCSEYAWNVAMNLGRALAQSGVMTVSGGAKGIDTAGHVGTLAADGVTVVIFGTGLDKTYPAENRELFAKVLERGSWVSEYPFGTGGNIWQFPERDRLISAMASRVASISFSEGIIPVLRYIFLTGSPGDIYVSKKVRKLIPIRTISICSNLLPSLLILNLDSSYLLII